MHTSGYSGTPLARKLGIKEGFKIGVVDPPVCYFDLFGDLPANIHLLDDNEARPGLVMMPSTG